jgi:hypothetical protein
MIGQGQLDGKGGPFVAPFAVRVDGAFVHFYQHAGDGEAQAKAAELVRAGAFGVVTLGKGFKNILDLFVRHADAGIGDGNDPIVFVSINRTGFSKPQTKLTINFQRIWSPIW